VAGVRQANPPKPKSGSPASRGGPVPEAAESDLPEPLVNPPWASPRTGRERIVIRGLEPSSESRVVWDEGERDRYLAAAEHGPAAADWEQRARRCSDHGSWGELLACAPREIADKHLDRWNGHLGRFPALRAAAYARAVLARYEAAVADRVVVFLASAPELGAILGPILTPEAARLAARWFRRRGAAGRHGAAWLDRHGEAAAESLVPGALGPAKALRIRAEGALLRIAETHGRGAVLEAAAVYGETARRGIEALLEAGAVDTLPERVPSPGPWFDPSRLPRVLLRGGESALPEPSLRHLLTIMGIALAVPDDERLAVVAETCEHDSLREFSWAVFEQWLAGGAPSADGWVMSSLRHFGDDETVARLTERIQTWPGQHQHHRAVSALSVLSGIGSDTALRAIRHISLRAKYKGIRTEAGHRLGAVAGRLGLSREQLADRLLPDFGLDEDGVLVLDYGPRRFRVAFDELLKPYVTDEAGRPRKTLPEPGVKDDPELAGAAHRRFSELKRELRTVSADQIRRLEAAMVGGRLWSREEFEERLLRHPLMRHPVRRLVWLAEDGERRLGFRVAEDATFCDAADEAVALPEEAGIRLAHPLDLSEGERAAWSRILADYEILQPFEQVRRPVMAFTGRELATGRLERFEGAVVPAGSILGLTGRGWVRCRPQDGGTEFGCHFPLPGGGHVAVRLEPGLRVGRGAAVADQRLAAVFLADRLDPYCRPSGEGRPRGVDPVIASEVLTDLARLTGKE